MRIMLLDIFRTARSFAEIESALIR